MLMKSHPARNVPKKLIRITKFEVFRNGLKAENYSVMSSNRYDLLIDSIALLSSCVRSYNLASTVVVLSENMPSLPLSSHVIYSESQ